MSNAPPPPGGTLIALYHASYGRLVAAVGAITNSSRADAEDAVQEAFAALVPRWESVARYDDPEAWVRRVALRKSSNRSRKLRNGVLALQRKPRPGPVPPPSADDVDLARALAKLPVSQRAVVVLTHLGLSVPEIADELRIPQGTVKSRLHRARAALQPLLSRDEPVDVP